MHGARPSYMILCALACVALACGGVSGSMPIPPAATGLAPAFASTSPSENHDLGVRSCLYDPAAPEPAPAFSVPAGTPTPYPTSTPPSESAAEPQDVVRQTAVFTGFWNAVNEHYVDPGFNGKDWGAIGDRYQTMIEGGLSDEAFYALLQEMINELGHGRRGRSRLGGPVGFCRDRRAPARHNRRCGASPPCVPHRPGGGSRATVPRHDPGRRWRPGSI
jgi:hypothetical protein